MPAPTEWWDELSSRRPGPARIRVTFNRDLTEAEKEHLRQVGELVRTYVGDKLRISPDQRVYIESQENNSRDLFEALSSVVATSFVNVFPTAVRTFRERMEKPAPKLETVNVTGLTTTMNNQYTPYEGTNESDYNLPDQPKKHKKKKVKM